LPTGPLAVPLRVEPVSAGDHLTTEHDPDDWFNDADTADREWGTVYERAPLEDWLQSEPPSGRALPTLDRRILLAAGAAVVVAVVVLVVVLSGGGKSHAPAATTAPGSGAGTPRTNAAPPATPTRPVTPAPTAPLKLGDTGAQVRVLQRALRKLGYSTGKIDGGYGPATQAAVARFQRAKGLTADGVVGAKTLAALKAALRQAT
jgi:putative peptidoglycan binding protein